LSIDVFKNSGITDKGEWYDIAAAEITYLFPIANLTNRSIANIRVYRKTGLSTLTLTGNFLNSANSILSTFTTVDTDTGSTANYSEIIAPVPAGATRMRLTASAPAYVFVQPSQLAPFGPLNATIFTTSQSITVDSTVSFALLGGGGSGGSRTDNSSHRGGGGGSGYLTSGTVNAGTYTLTIGTGAPGSTSPTTGGTSSFSTFNALGGSPGAPGSFNGAGGTGGAGGSGGGQGANINVANSAGSGGINGNNGNPGGAGSGTPAVLFTSGPGGSGGTGGGAYAGGSGATNGGAGGGSANGAGGGGAGSASSGAPAAGGAGGAGALWILFPQ